MNNKGYVFINLLPYREQMKKEQIKQFSLLMGLFAIIACFIVFLIYSTLSYEIEKQKSRNDYIEKTNKKLDEDIKAIVTLKDEIKETLAKRKVVENLQINRSDTVNILNLLSSQLPEGVTLKKITEADNKINIVGNTLSNNKVSNYMTNLAATDSLINPELVEIRTLATTANKKPNAKVKDDRVISEFTMNVYLKPKVEIIEEEKPVVEVKKSKEKVTSKKSAKKE